MMSYVVENMWNVTYCEIYYEKHNFKVIFVPSRSCFIHWPQTYAFPSESAQYQSDLDPLTRRPLTCRSQNGFWLLPGIIQRNSMMSWTFLDFQVENNLVSLSDKRWLTNKFSVPYTYHNFWRDNDIDRFLHVTRANFPLSRHSLHYSVAPLIQLQAGSKQVGIVTPFNQLSWHYFLCWFQANHLCQ